MSKPLDLIETAPWRGATFGERPFVLSRTGYAGLHCYSTMCTGDNRTEVDHMP